MTPRRLGTFVCLIFLAAAANLNDPATTLAEQGTLQPAGLLGEGTEWETPWYEINSGKEGPTVLVTGGVHGNEPAGYRAAEQIRTWPILRGRLIVVPCVNKPGLEAGIRWLPSLRNNDALRDANRNFPKDDGPSDALTAPCQNLWELTKRFQPDWVFDLHEGFDFHIANKKSVGSSLIGMKDEASTKLAEKIVHEINRTIADEKRRFVVLGQPQQGSFVRAAIEQIGCRGFIIETTSRGQPLSLRTRQQRLAVSSLLLDLGMIETSCIDRIAPSNEEELRHVAIYDGPGTGLGGVRMVERIFDADARFTPHCVGPEDLQSAELSQFSLLVFPGGSGSAQAKSIGPAAREKVRKFVRNGGGYLGICAGAYLCSADYDWSLNLVDSKVFNDKVDVPNVGVKSMWYRGTSQLVEMELTDEGRKILGDWHGKVQVRYHNGPIVSPAGRKDLATYIPLAYFRTEVSLWEAQNGTMVNTPAIVANHFGDGRVIAISPHPEASRSLRSIINRSAAWLCKLQVTPAIPKAQAHKAK